MTIVVAYTPCPEGKAALSHGIGLAESQGEALLVINASAGTAYVDSSLATEDDAAEVRAHLESLAVPATSKQLIRGKDAAEEIIDLTDEINPSLIVVGLHKRSAVGKLILGSTARRILLGVECPVLSVRSPRGRQHETRSAD
ncbi:universal stress protein [Paeniglutamicibacter sp. NPDC091659]|uniref:universal stress protein n=1 Tax=Paeniglutamicibacter sp. NPDC091659 TaxID=3364389 RepID=UPI00380E45BF